MSIVIGMSYLSSITLVPLAEREKRRALSCLEGRWMEFTLKSCSEIKFGSLMDTIPSPTSSQEGRHLLATGMLDLDFSVSFRRRRC